MLRNGNGKGEKGRDKGGIAYEVREETGNGCYKLKEKPAHSNVMDGKIFCEGFTVSLANRCGLSRVDKAILSADGDSGQNRVASLLVGFSCREVW